MFEFLETKVREYNNVDFIANDPISVPHSFTKRQDIEIAGFFAAIFAWGQRTTIISKARYLMTLMDDAPHQFMLHHTTSDLKPFLTFCHRTFNAADALYFIHFLRWFYQKHQSLEAAFRADPAEPDTEMALIRFHQLFFSLPEAPERTRKHISTPERRSTCKRLSMYLRWMVRRDDKGVDFGLWSSIRPAQLVCPFDLHVDRISRRLRLIRRAQSDWQTALELTRNLRVFDPVDPVKYDFALFGVGVNERNSKWEF